MATREPTTYWDYLRLDTLLDLQSGLADEEAKLENEEVMFIIIHQIDELWFKLGIREVASARDHFAQEQVPEASMARAVRGLRRVTRIFEKLTDHFELMETLTTRDYLAFRDKLSPASGFQSGQMREIEILLGLDMNERIPLGHESYLRALKHKDGSPSSASRRVEARLNDETPSLREAIDAWLCRTPIEGSTPDDPGDEATVTGFLERYLAAHRVEVHKIQAAAMQDALTPADRERLEARYAKEIASARAYLMADELEPEMRVQTRRKRAAVIFIESYRELPLLTWPRELVDALVELEQAFVVFRQRHARMVERVIGRRTGTGGSAGVDYLDQTALKYRIFKDLWAARTLLLRREALPTLEQPGYYDFAESGR